MPPPNHNDYKTECKKGHPFTPANTRYYGPNNSWRKCRECNRLNSGEFRRAKRLEEKREMGLKYVNLGQTELAVWGLVAQGLLNPQIANELGFTVGYIENTISALFNRFNVENRVQLAKIHWSNQAIIKGL